MKILKNGNLISNSFEEQYRNCDIIGYVNTTCDLISGFSANGYLRRRILQDTLHSRYIISGIVYPNNNIENTSVAFSFENKTSCDQLLIKFIYDEASSIVTCKAMVGNESPTNAISSYNGEGIEFEIDTITNGWFRCRKVGSDDWVTSEIGQYILAVFDNLNCIYIGSGVREYNSLYFNGSVDLTNLNIIRNDNIATDEAIKGKLGRCFISANELYEI